MGLLDNHGKKYVNEDVRCSARERLYTQSANTPQ